MRICAQNALPHRHKRIAGFIAMQRLALAYAPFSFRKHPTERRSLIAPSPSSPLSQPISLAPGHGSLRGRHQGRRIIWFESANASMSTPNSSSLCDDGSTAAHEVIRAVARRQASHASKRADGSSFYASMSAGNAPEERFSADPDAVQDDGKLAGQGNPRFAHP
jgi:hypothetical protein